MGSTGDDRWRSGEQVEHVDGRRGVLVRPGGFRCFVVRFGKRDELVKVEDLRPAEKKR